MDVIDIAHHSSECTGAVKMPMEESTDAKHISTSFVERSQIMALERELAFLGAEIARQERAMNALVYGLYGLGAEEIEMLEKG